MTRRFIQRWLRGVAALAAVLMIQGSLDAFHLAVDHDPDFALPFVSAGVTRVEQPSRPGVPVQHCAICHWLRSLGTTHVAARTLPIPPRERAGSMPVGAIASIHRARARRAVRGPPLG